MKKIFIVLCLIPSVAFTQLNDNNVFANKLRAGVGFIPPRFSDTTAANLSQYKDSAAALIIATGADKLWFRNSTATAWVSTGGISGITGDNGLTASTSTNVQLGGTLTGNTTIATGANKLTISTSTTGVNPLYVSSNDDYAIRGVSTSAVAIYGQSTNDFGLSGYSGSVEAIVGTTQPASTNTVAPVMRLTRASTGTIANGAGESIDFNMSTATGGANSNQIISKWTDATHATRTSQFIITGVNSGSAVDLLTLYGEGAVKLNPITATAASAITAADGMLIYVSSTNGTFTSVGIWARENGVWVKL